MENIRSESRRQELLALATSLGVEFRDLSLLQQALTHTSFANANVAQAFGHPI